jgi:hypothetical protein
MTARDDFIHLLASQERLPLLAQLIEELAMRARGEYAAAETGEGGSLAALTCINELVLVVSVQLSSSLEGKPAYPDDAFLQTLIEKSEGRECQGNLQQAVRSSLQSLTRRRHFGGSPTMTV